MVQDYDRLAHTLLATAVTLFLASGAVAYLPIGLSDAGLVSVPGAISDDRAALTVGLFVVGLLAHVGYMVTYWYPRLSLGPDTLLIHREPVGDEIQVSEGRGGADD